MRVPCFRYRSRIVAGLVATALWSSGALGASVSWNAPANCPSETEVRERVEAERGGPLGEDREPTFVATVRQEAAGRFTLTVQAPSGEGDRSTQTRVLQATECEELVAAFAQMVSLALGPAPASESAGADATGAPDDGANSSERASARPNELPSTNEQERPNDPEGPVMVRRKDERARVALLALLDTASLGEASLGAQLLAGVSLGPRFELRGGLAYFPPHTVAGIADDDASGRFSLALAAFLACAAWSDSAWRLPLCAGFEGGFLNAMGTGVEKPQAEVVGWTALRAEASIGFELGANLRVTVLGGLVVPLARHEFSVAGAELLEIPGISLRAGFGLEYAL